MIKTISLVLMGCLGVLNMNAQEEITVQGISFNVMNTYQTIDNFAASDAWSCQFVGNWPDQAKNAMADWLFSMDTFPNGNPKGIGLSLWRFNLGAGSAQQGDSSGIKDEWRRAESFLDNRNQFNSNYCKGQLWFLQAAKQRGVQQFLGFFNSPPAPYTVNGKTYASKGKCNLAANREAQFAAYTVKAIKTIKQQTGVTFNYISPVNEPQWQWSDGGQEGCPYTNKEISRVTKAFNNALSAGKLTKTYLIVSEAGSLKYLVEEVDSSGKGRQIANFFKPGANYIGNLSNVKKVMAGHSYFTTSPFNDAIALRKKVAEQVATVKGLHYWQSEYCILGDNAGELNGQHRDTGMTSALYLARSIYADLVAGNATAWQWWLAISPYNYKDGLIYIDKSKTGGNYHDSKMLWALGNYSRFIRPGMKRIYGKVADSAVLISAYIDEPTRKLIVVIVNSSEQRQHYSLRTGMNSWRKPEPKKTTWNVYTTSATASLEKKEQLKGRVDIGPQSIVTIETEY